MPAGLRKLGLSVFALWIALGLSGCRHEMVLRSVPEGAEIWVNSVPLGRAPAIFETRSGFPEEARIKVAMEGYEVIRDLPIEKRYRADISLLWLIPGLFPYLFTARYDDEFEIKLEKSAEGQR
jgi:hypothetical protein